MKYIISAGGTGGHIYPALAIIDEIKKNDKDAKFIYIGTHNRMEKDLVPKRNIPYEALEIYGLSKTQMFRNIKNIFLLKKAYKKCLKIYQEFKPDFVIGVGGYVTYPVIKAAKKLNIKTLIHEQNSIPGKTNKNLAKIVDKVMVSFEDSKKYFSTNNVVYTGNPCEKNAANIKKVSKKELGFKENKKLILFCSGSLGSETINSKCLSFLKNAKNKDYQILYVAGTNFYKEYCKNKFPENVKVVPFIDNLPAVMKTCDLMVSRAGASTISEIMAINVPTILIPSPYVANNHQYYNALSLTNKKCAKLIEEKNLNEKTLSHEIDNLIIDTNALNNMKNNIKKEHINNKKINIYDVIAQLK